MTTPPTATTGLIIEVEPDPEMDYEPSSKECHLCKQPIGWAWVSYSEDSDTDRVGFRTYFELRSDPEDTVTELCEDCMGWMEDIAPAVLAHAMEAAAKAKAWQERFRLAASTGRRA